MISDQEKERRRKLVANAHWNNRVEGLGEPTEQENKINDLWIEGKITKEQHQQAIIAFAKMTIAMAGHG